MRTTINYETDQKWDAIPVVTVVAALFFSDVLYWD